MLVRTPGIGYSFMRYGNDMSAGAGYKVNLILAKIHQLKRLIKYI